MHKNLIIASSFMATVTAISSVTLLSTPGLAAPGQFDVCAVCGLRQPSGVESARALRL